MDLLTIICVGVIFLLGVPHGAFDPSIAQHSLKCDRFFLKGLFYILYLVLAIAAFIVWLNLPVISLAIFLLVSCLHFGRERESDSRYGGLPFGCVVVGLPALFKFDEVTSIFAVITLESGVEQGVVAITYCIALAGFCGLVLCIRDVMQRRQVAFGAELGLLMLCAYVTTPLVYFTLYFCLIHSLRHIVYEFRNLPLEYRKGSVINAALVMGSTSILAIWGYQQGAILEYQSDRLLFLTFAGLAALTYPHMVLMEFVRRERKRSLSMQGNLPQNAETNFSKVP